MKALNYRGKRIKVSDKNIIYNFMEASLLLIFLMVLLILYSKQFLLMNG